MTLWNDEITIIKKILNTVGTVQPSLSSSYTCFLANWSRVEIFISFNYSITDRDKRNVLHIIEINRDH